MDNAHQFEVASPNVSEDHIPDFEVVSKTKYNNSIDRQNSFNLNVISTANFKCKDC